MKLERVRKYEMGVRAQSAENTSKDIMRAIGELWLKHSLHDITLEMLAAEAGVTVRTILRKYGSKEALLEAAIKADTAGIEFIKDTAKVGDIENIVSVLMQEYDRTGMAGIRTLAIENDFPMAAKALKKAREMHMKWCEVKFAPFLSKEKIKKNKIMLGAIYAATDVYKWKLLYKDLGYSKEETEKIFIKTLKAITKSKN